MVCVLISAVAVFFLQWYGINCATINDSEVILVHVLFQHGHETPQKFYPSDPNKNKTFYPVGPGGLTNKGKMMVFKLGSLLRENYGTILGPEYTEGKLEVRSSDTTKTKVSALLALAGLWPPNENQQWHPNLTWQPIPVTAKPFKDEDLLDSSFCEFKKMVLESQTNDTEVQKEYIESQRSLFEYIEKHSSLAITDPIDLLNFYFILKAEEGLDLELPEWSKNIYPEPLHSIAARSYEYMNYNQDVRKINAGYLLQKMVKDSVAKINNELEPSERKMFLYSADGITLGCFMNALNVFNKQHVPPYGSAVILELNKKGHDYLFKVKKMFGEGNRTCLRECYFAFYQSRSTYYPDSRVFQF